MAKKKSKRPGATGKGSGAPPAASESDIEKDGEHAAEESESEGAEERDEAAGERESKPAEPAPDASAAAKKAYKEPVASEAPKSTVRKGAAWGEPIARFETAWTKFETRLITWVLVAQLLSMVSWVLLSGLSSPLQSGNAAGFVIRAVLGAAGLGAGAWSATRKQPLNTRRAAAIGGILVGVLIAPLWRQIGVEYFDNVKAWMQEGSTLTLMGGLRGVATRLTLWLALLGASLATASGKHINIDVIFRFVPARFRAPIAVVNYAAAGLMCAAAVWGFFDHIAIESFGAKADDSPSAKMSAASERMSDHFFLMRKQMGLDVRALPHVLKGDRFDQWMSAKAWNDWVKDASFESHYKPEEVETVLIPEDAPPHTPLVVAPDGEATRGVLVHDLSLVFPFGMLAIALRFLLRALLVLSKHVEVDPDAAHKEEIGTHTASAEPKKEGA